MKDDFPDILTRSSEVSEVVVSPVGGDTTRTSPSLEEAFSYSTYDDAEGSRGIGVAGAAGGDDGAAEGGDGSGGQTSFFSAVGVAVVRLMVCDRLSSYETSVEPRERLSWKSRLGRDVGLLAFSSSRNGLESAARPSWRGTSLRRKKMQSNAYLEVYSRMKPLYSAVFFYAAGCPPR